jgi:tetratricopeptide (TPR) repeat protein
MGRKLPSLSRALALCAAGQLLTGSASAATVISVGDGDTLRVADHAKTITIQMAFSDAPKMAQAPYRKPVAEQSSGLSRKVLEWIKQANAFESQGAYGKAAELWEKVLSWSEKTQGPEHPNTANSLNNLAGLYYKQGAYTKAEPLFKRALAIYAKTLGPDHPDSAISLNSLAVLYYNQGAHSKAEPLYLRALAIREKAHGPDHPDTALTRDLLEQCRKTLSKRDSGD